MSVVVEEEEDDDDDWIGALRRQRNAAFLQRDNAEVEEERPRVVAALSLSSIARENAQLDDILSCAEEENVASNG